MTLDKLSTTGTVLWSVEPQDGNPTGLFPVGTGPGFQLAVSMRQNTSAPAAPSWACRPPPVAAATGWWLGRGIFALGYARFSGSVGGLALVDPVVAIT